MLWNIMIIIIGFLSLRTLRLVTQVQSIRFLDDFSQDDLSPGAEVK